MKGCRTCPNDNCIDCFGDDTIDYSNTIDEETFRNEIKNSSKYTILLDKIYCREARRGNDNIMRGLYFVWNKYKRKMILIIGFDQIVNGGYCIFSDNEKRVSHYLPPEECNNEYLQAMRQGYEFTFKDHIYEKNNNYFIYNNETLKFDKILDDLQCEMNKINIEMKKNCIIGEEEKCKSCNSKEPEFCGSCNDGYYLSEVDKTKCKKCSMKSCRTCPYDICIDCFGDEKMNYPDITDKEALNKEMKEKNIKMSDADRIYYDGKIDSLSGLKHGNHFVWNKYKRKMIQIINLNIIDNEYNCKFNIHEKKISISCKAEVCDNEYFQAIRQGYEFTFKDHIYEKNNNYFIYNNKTLKFDEILDDLKCEINVANVKIKKNCNVGANEKCKSCDSKEPEFCGSCNDGYYLSEKNKTKCTPCSIEKCKVCTENYCLHCLDDDKEINYLYLTEEMALDYTLKNMNLYKPL